MRRGGGGGVRRSLPEEWCGEDEGRGRACGEAEEEEEEEEEDGEKEREGTSKAGWNDYVRGGVSPPGRLSRASFSSASLFPPPPALLGLSYERLRSHRAPLRRSLPGRRS